MESVLIPLLWRLLAEKGPLGLAVPCNDERGMEDSELLFQPVVCVSLLTRGVTCSRVCSKVHMLSDF